MDTGSESFLSTQNTPNSIRSCEFDEKDQNDLNKDKVLSSQRPSENDQQNVLRLSEPLNKENCNINNCKFKENINDSLVINMAKLKLETLDFEDGTKTRPSNLGISPPKFSSTLTSTTNHPLMGSGSPVTVDNYPDIIPDMRQKKCFKIEDEIKDSSLSSVEENNISSEMSLNYHPERNTSKNNLYFSENTESGNFNMSPPDVARVPHDHQKHKQKLQNTSISRVDDTMDVGSISKYVEERKKKLGNQCMSTPKTNVCDSDTEAIHIPVREDFALGVSILITTLNKKCEVMF